ncbi:MAG TPA: polysaccharide biosynthesis/export family protein [Xanthobacteraceae bacterium]|jgi:polysaccharide export outer membrane protein
MGHRFWGLACAGLALTLAGCNTDSLELGTPVVAAHAEAAAPARRPAGPYVLGLNDMVRVRVYNEPDLSGEYVVDSAGYMSIPLAGRVRAAGLTPDQLQHAIMSRLSNGLIKEPHVTVEVSTYTPIYIQGEVKRAGEFAYRPGLTVMDVVAEAGGFTYRANEHKVYIQPKGGRAEQLYPLDASVSVHPGDNIRITERYF